MFGARFVGAFTEEYAGINNATGLVTDVVGTTGDGVAGIGTNPDLRANTTFTYAKGAHNVRATLRYTAGSINLDPNIRAIIPYIATDQGSLNCLSCHQVENGTVLGAVEIILDLSSYRTLALSVISGIVAFGHRV